MDRGDWWVHGVSESDTAEYLSTGVKQTAGRKLLHSTGSSAWRFVMIWGWWGEWVSRDCCRVHGAATLLSGFPQEGRVGGGCIRLPVAARSSGDSEGHPAESLSLNPTSWLSKLKHITCHL